MNISKIEAYALSSPIDPVLERPFYGGVRRLLKRDVVLVVVETADGERGIGPSALQNPEVKGSWDEFSYQHTADVINDRVAPWLEGEHYDDILQVHDRLNELGLRPAVDTAVASGLDVALYDILGKRHGMPVYELLRDRYGVSQEATCTLPLVASSGMYLSPEDHVEEAMAFKEQGFAGYKFRPGLGPAEDAETFKQVREAVGDDFKLIADVSTWWEFSDEFRFELARDTLRSFEEADPYWVEEPAAPDDYKGYKRLAETTEVPLAGGESEFTSERLCDLAETGAVSFLQGDVRCHRGFMGCWQAIERCRKGDAQYVPHNFGTWLAFVASAHLVAAAPGSYILSYEIYEDDPVLDMDNDYGMYPFELAFDILQDPLDLEDGQFNVPNGPGLGVDVDLSVVDDYPHQEGHWTEVESKANARADQ